MNNQAPLKFADPLKQKQYESKYNKTTVQYHNSMKKVYIQFGAIAICCTSVYFVGIPLIKKAIESNEAKKKAECEVILECLKSNPNSKEKCDFLLRKYSHCIEK